MRPLTRLARGRKGTLSFGGTGGNWSQPPFWSWADARDKEVLDHNFEGYVEQAYRSNGIVFACILTRMMVFSEARFQFQRLEGGRPTDLFGSPALSILERPWPGGTTGELLARMEQDASLAGNFYGVALNDQGQPVSGRSAQATRLRRLRPDWVTIVTGVPGVNPERMNPWDIRARVVGYMYTVRDGISRPDPILLLPEQVAHYSPHPDPGAQWRGMSWITSVTDEIKADKAATKHKLKYFEHGTTGGIYIKYAEGTSEEEIRTFADLWKEQHQGVDNAYKAFHLGGGADPKTLGADLKQLEFKATQGAGETRVAAASGVGAIIAQLSEGMQGSALNAGNYGAARRRFGDVLVRPLWRMASASLEVVVPPPPAARLWYDARDVSFLQEDEKDASEILAQQAGTIARLIEAGFSADEAVRAVTSGDLRSLSGAHSGLFSVQLQEAGAGATNGNGQ